MQNYEEYKESGSTEKIVLATIDPSKRIIGFTLHSGSVYKITGFNYSVILSIKDSGVAYNEVSSLAFVSSPGTYFNDKNNSTLYLWSSDSSNPNSRFLVLNYRMFFSNVPIELPYDLSTGYDVEWIPYILSTSDFGVEIDNENQQGFAIEGSGSINLANVQDFWRPIFDKITFENKPVTIYSFFRGMPISEVRIIYKGKITKKSWTPSAVQFGLKDIISELKAEVELPNIEDYPGAVVSSSLALAKQRNIYGYLFGHVPTPIDQIVDGYLGTGTISFTYNDINVVGVGTSFLSELSPDDEIFIDGIDESYTVSVIIDDTNLQLTEEFAFGSQVNKPFYIKPSLPKRYKNRKFLVAGHATKEPSTTITQVVSLNYFQVADSSDIRSGDRLEINGQSVFVRRVNNNYIKLRSTLTGTPLIGDVVLRPSVSDVYIQDKRLLDNSYTYDASTGELLLDDDAEFKVSQTKLLLGTQITLTSGSRTVIGVDTSFDAQLKPGDWVRTESQVDFFEVLQVISATELELRTPSTYNSTNLGLYRSPNYYDESNSTLSVDCIGKTKNGLKTGVFINSAAEIVEDLLIEAGLGSDLDSASFVETKALAPQRIGLAFPPNMSDKKSVKLRDLIGDISESVFGSLVQTSEYKLAYRVLSPKRKLSDIKFNEIDLISFTINSDSSKIIKTALVNYLFKEFDYVSLAKSNLQVSHTPLVNEFLTDASIVNTYDSKLVDLNDAKIMAERYALILQLSRAKVNIQTKLRATELTATDKVWLDHEKLYDRVGLELKQKIGAVESIKKNGFRVALEIEDLSNAFSRCSIITENDAFYYLNASENELMINGYITDPYGMILNDANTYGINLIW